MKLKNLLGVEEKILEDGKLKVLVFDREKELDLEKELKKEEVKSLNDLKKVMIEHLGKEDYLIVVKPKKEAGEEVKGYIYLIGEELPIALCCDSLPIFVGRPNIPINGIADIAEILVKYLKLGGPILFWILKEFEKENLEFLFRLLEYEIRKNNIKLEVYSYFD